MKTSFEFQNGAIVPASDEQAPILVYVSPGDEERRQMVETLGLDPYDVDSALDPDEPSRLEVSSEGMALIWKAPRSAMASQGLRLEVCSVGFFRRRDRLLIVMSEGPLPFSDKGFSGVRDTSDVILRFLLHTVRHYVGHLKVVKQLSGALESKITTSMENRYLLQMFSLSESLIYYLDAIEANGVAITKLRGLGDKLGFHKNQIELLDDIVLENNQCARQAQIYSTVMSGLMDARGTIVNNNMNVLLKNLTVINIVFLPLNLIASIGGMSEFSMMAKGMDWRVAYFLFSLGMVILGWATWRFVVRALEKRPANAR